VTGEGGPCSFCGASRGPFATVEGLFTVLICIPCLDPAGPTGHRLGLHDSGPYPAMTPAEMRESLELLPSWVLEQKAAANRQVIAVMRQRLAAGEQVARMYQEPGLAWLERQGRGRRAAAHRAAGRRPEPIRWRSALNGLTAPAVPATDRSVRGKVGQPTAAPTAAGWRGQGDSSGSSTRAGSPMARPRMPTRSMGMWLRQPSRGRCRSAGARYPRHRSLPPASRSA
jgi:hypothetical protein